MIIFFGESKKNILLKVLLLVYTWLVIEKPLSHLNQMTIKVGYRILEIETTKGQVLTRALLPRDSNCLADKCKIFYRSKIGWYVNRHLRVCL